MIAVSVSNGVDMDGKGQYAKLPSTEPQIAEPDKKEGNGVSSIDHVKLLRAAQENGGEGFIDEPAFQCFGALLIISNAFAIGLETDLEWKYWPVVELSFLGAFTFELLIRIAFVGPCSFVSDHRDSSWNIFDLFVVGLGQVDFVVGKLSGRKRGIGGFATIFRMIRLLRILRIFRVLKFVKQLYVLAFGLMEAVKAVFWVTILMAFVLYICAIVLVKTIGRPPEDHPYHEFLTYRFGHIPDAMLTLFILMSSANLPDYENTTGLLQHNLVFTLFLCIFVMFASFGIVALLTGIMSESMSEKNEARKQQVRAEHEAMREKLGQQCEAIFRQLPNLDANGETTTESVKTLAPQMWDMLEKCGAEMTHADVIRIIEFMDVNGTGMINLTEFREVVEKISEGLSPLGIQEVASRVGLCEAKIDKMQVALETVRRQNMEISRGMQLILSRLETQSGNLRK